KVDFSANAASALQQGELLNLQYLGQIPSAYPASISGTIFASVPYLGPDDDGDGSPDLRVQQKTLPVVVDKDDPASAFTAPQDGLYLRGSAYVVGGTSRDPSTWVTKVEVDLGDGNWQEINNPNDLNPWALRWNLPADNVYTLRTRATDYVGRVGGLDTVQVTVDNTPPQVTLAATTDLDGVIYLKTDPTNPKVITMTGTATDNLAGVERVQISIDNRPWREVTYNSSTTGWEYGWGLPPRDAAQGEHKLRLRAFDKSGNVSTILAQEVVVDVLPPTSRLTDSAFNIFPVPNVPANQNVPLTGFLDENGRGPQPARPNPLSDELDTLQDATIWLEPFAIGDISGGAQAIWVGDMNGDRLADAAIGLPTAGDNNEGSVTIVYGQPGDWPVPPLMQGLDKTPTAVSGNQTNARIGAHLAAPGDINGDGLDDLIIGDKNNQQVWIIFGNFNPLGRHKLDVLPKSARMSIKLDQTLKFVSSAGDVDGDGLGDYFIGETNRTSLILGRPACCDNVTINDMAAAQLSQTGQHITLGVGDMNGDQLDDFVATANNKVHVFFGDQRFTRTATDRNRVNNPIQLQLSDAAVSFDTADANPRVAPLGDTNNTAVADFIYSNGTTPQLVLGQSQANPILGSQLAFTPAVSGFLAGPGDVNGDGCTDLILGNTADNAVLVHGVGNNCASAYEVKATFTRAVGAASAPGFSAGADLNADGSADILLIPEETGPAQTKPINFGNQPYIHPNQLALAPLSNRNDRNLRQWLNQLRDADDNLNAPTGTTRYVDDDYCNGCPNDGHTWGADAFSDIPQALAASSANDIVQVMPGVYNTLDLSNAHDYITIRGIDPDAVFIDSLNTNQHAVQINGAKGIHLENLTLRRAERGLELINAGVGGFDNPADKIYLHRVLIHGSQHPIYMDRASNLVLEKTTLIGDGTNANIYID
ncbi:MAG: FG-GAP repeat protein, partial [Anaerolineales bacterium]|nr:FG-GAP repeat protein [Anaerolineales bacterium]